MEEKIPEGKKSKSPRKLKVDEKNRFHMVLPNGEQEIIQLTESEIYSLENYFFLVSKNKLRLEILNILQIYGELNITQLSQKVEQSKSTVARHLHSLEKHGIVVARKAREDEYEPGKIPPKLYQRNLKFFKILQYTISLVPEPDDPEKLREFFRRQTKGIKNSLSFFKWLLEKTDPLFDKILNQLENNNLDDAREIWLKYIDESTSPALLGIDGRSFNEKYYGEVMEAYEEFMEKFTKILIKQNADPEVKDREHTAIFAFLPVKDLYDIYKEEILDKKKQL